jgi:hypothetical protein
MINEAYGWLNLAESVHQNTDMVQVDSSPTCHEFDEWLGVVALTMNHNQHSLRQVRETRAIQVLMPNRIKQK